ncbi:uncharacterized protein FOMMEDRAFT_23062 [Fomitiporia mediterranea MF3/22]|uniref:uncharacterized protein n=1 Tax=Fomitiporia mediterranea (strain MF3/22) TaxID=694068 RepID=UPI0004408F44|nr:uncharacterized protein FOMMEDRAFT_23062 [Fomitiporia mediterranea MF3/22]EJC99150.1 hypothetical protein FOMMEDRAFT_23062 [Fomitiporia mediterranea MF3/22]
MLFRQNFVHQRHVPGSIETSHNSLSKIVGNCWKSLPSKDKKVWEALAEKKKEEHKIQYPHYRFQPKHDPEKKRKRQAVRAAAEKAERERLLREHGTDQSTPQDTNPDKLQLQEANHDQEKERAMASRRQQVCAMHNHLGHRRSSSVPLPSESYPGYPYTSDFGGPFAQGAPADPFNFANPALAQAPPANSNAPTSNGITIPTLPSSIGGFSGYWYGTNGIANADQTTPAISEQADALLPLPHLHAPQPRSAILSRSASPRVPMNGIGMSSIAGGFGEFSGMSSMGMGTAMNYMGMGPRASRQWALGQLGRRASSTQPILQHQLASGVFADLQYGAQSNFPHPGAPFGQYSLQGFQQGASGPFDFGSGHNQQQSAFDGFVGAVAEGFTNPFASSNQPTSAAVSNADPAPTPAPGSYPTPLAPNAMWYQVDSVDPMTPVQQQPHSQGSETSGCAQALPPVDTGVLNPAFDFGKTAQGSSDLSGSGASVDVPSSPKSASASAPHSAMRAHFGPTSAPVQSSNSAPGTGMRDSFDFSAFNAFFSQNSAHHQHQHQVQNQTQPQDLQGFENVAQPTMSSSANGFSIVQPVPVRKVGLPRVPETHSGTSHHQEQAYPQHGSYQEHYVPDQAQPYSQEQVASYQEHTQYQASQQSSNGSSGSNTDASPASGLVAMAPRSQHHSQHQQHGIEIVSGHELLDGPVDVNALSSAHHNSNLPQQVQTQGDGSCASDTDATSYGYDFNGVASLEAQNVYQMHMGIDADMGNSYGGYACDTQSSQAQDGSTGNGSTEHAGGPRFSFSDFVHGSPFVSATSVAN